MIPRTMGLAVTQINLADRDNYCFDSRRRKPFDFQFCEQSPKFSTRNFCDSFRSCRFSDSFSSRGQRRRRDIFIHNFSKTFRQILFFIIPASILILFLRAQIVRVVLGAGKFDWEDTILTFQALGIFAVSLFAQSAIPLLARAFFALHNTRVPFFAGIASEAVNLGAALILSRYYGLLGLVWAFSLSNIIEMFFLDFDSSRNRLNDLDDKKIISVILKISVSALAAGLVAQLAKYLINPYINLDTFLGVFIQMVFAGIIGITAYLALSHLFNLEEFHYLKKLFSTRIFRFRPPLPEDPTEASGI